MIREVHVYGRLVEIGARDDGRSQHLGLGLDRQVDLVPIVGGEQETSRVAAIGAVGQTGTM